MQSSSSGRHDHTVNSRSNLQPSLCSPLFPAIPDYPTSLRPCRGGPTTVIGPQLRRCNFTFHLFQRRHQARVVVVQCIASTAYASTKLPFTSHSTYLFNVKEEDRWAIRQARMHTMKTASAARHEVHLVHDSIETARCSRVVQCGWNTGWDLLIEVGWINREGIRHSIDRASHLAISKLPWKLELRRF